MPIPLGIFLGLIGVQPPLRPVIGIAMRLTGKFDAGADHSGVSCQFRSRHAVILLLIKAAEMKRQHLPGFQIDHGGP